MLEVNSVPVRETKVYKTLTYLAISISFIQSINLSYLNIKIKHSVKVNELIFALHYGLTSKLLAHIPLRQKFCRLNI